MKTNFPTALIIDSVHWTCYCFYTLLVSCLTNRPTRTSSSTDWSWQLLCPLKKRFTCCRCVTCAVAIATSLLPCQLLLCNFSSSMYFVIFLYSDRYKMSKRLKNYLDTTSESSSQRGHMHSPLRTLLHSAVLFCTHFSLRNYIHTLVHPRFPFVLHFWIRS